jgi:hypothetical protein
MNATPITKPQEKYIRNMFDEGNRLVQALGRTPAPVKVPDTFTEADALIKVMRKSLNGLRLQVRNLPTVQRVPSVPVQPKQTITDGMWVIGDVADGGTCFKVQYNKAMGDGRRLYAKRLTSEGVFVHAPGAIRDLIARGRKMTLEEAKFYGRLYGTCCRCGRTLTDEGSIEAGIGPICAEKF